ncbi:hypothetical protein E4U25_000569 [Claviceps purpurea]|nr:hypothetical protein E4U25_000569 [Claviceps purpurea]
MINQSLFNFAEKPQPLDTSLQPKGVAEAALLYDDILDNYKLEKCKNIADYAELSRARNSIYSFDSRWDLPDAILISIFMRGLGPSYKSWNSTFWLHNNLASTKNKDGSETDGFTFREVVDFAQKEEALQSQDDKNEVHALSAGELSVIIARNQVIAYRSSTCYIKYPEKLAMTKRPSEMN